MKAERCRKIETRSLGLLVEEFKNTVCNPNETHPRVESEQASLTSAVRLKFHVFVSPDRE